MSVSVDDVRRVARLARLRVADDRLDPMAKELSGIFEWIEMLNEVDVDGVEPMASAVDVSLPMRQDAVTDGDVRDKVLANAPNAEEGFFVVPKAVE